MNNSIAEQPIIAVKKLCKSFNGFPAVSNLTLNIAPGTIFGFLGPNGSGKTTSLRMLCGLILPDGGHGSCLGYDLFSQSKKIQANLGYMPQQFSLYRYMTVYENLDFVARIFSLQNKKERLDEIIEIFNLGHRKNQLANTLSGGWQQRLSLAAALLHQPRLLLLDEPTSGIDPQSRILIWNLIQRLVKEGMTILLSTQQMDEAERCHQLAYMAAGKILISGSAEEMTQTAGLYTWKITGNHLSTLNVPLSQNPDIVQVVEKGNEMRISGHYKDFVKTIPAELLQNYHLQKTETNLEDVFIYYIQKEGIMR